MSRQWPAAARGWTGRRPTTTRNPARCDDVNQCAGSAAARLAFYGASSIFAIAASMPASASRAAARSCWPPAGRRGGGARCRGRKAPGLLRLDLQDQVVVGCGAAEIAGRRKA